MGLAAWIVVGLVVGIGARWVPPAGHGCLVPLLAVAAAVAGGVLATRLGVGGAMDLDWVGVAIAGLAAAVAVVGFRVAAAARRAP